MSVLGGRTLAQRCRGQCGRPHWGYVIRGVVRVAYPDHDEVISAGDAYYVAPGHIAVHVDGAELVDFGPRNPANDEQETPCVPPSPDPPAS